MTESTDSRPSDQARDRRGNDAEQNVEHSVRRLEKAVQELVSVAKEEFSDRAGAFVEETTQRLRAEMGSARTSRDTSSRHARRHARRKARWARRAERISGRHPHRRKELVRDSRHEKICGVCAGLARYWGMETWVVRCIAITGLIFMPQIVVPAYFVTCLVMGKKRSKKHQPQERERDMELDHSTVAPEFGPILSPRNSLQNIQAELAQSELRLRRMETHVTSGHYELQRELNKIDREQEN